MRKLILILFPLIICACQQIIDIDISDNNDLVVIDGFLSSRDTSHVIRITRTVSFSSKQLSPPVTDAEVTVFYSENEEIQFLHTGEGRYESNSFILQASVQYRLQVILTNGDTIVSENETLKPAPAIDSLHYFSIDIPDTNIPRQTLERYYPVIYGVDAAQIKDFYLWNVFRNDTLLSTPQELILIEDRFFNGNSFRNEFTSFLFDEDDEIKLEVLMISKNAFSYLSQFKDQAINQNLNQPTNPNRLLGNLQNQSKPSEYVLGIFSISNSRFFSKKVESP